MIYKKILLKDIDERFVDHLATLRVYISERNEIVERRPGMLVCPGGGYWFCSPREAEIIAFRFLSEGFNCFVLDYTIQAKYPVPHLDLGLAISYIREHENEFDLLPNSLSIVGFSAGGHLVGSYGYLYKEIAKELNKEEQLLKPFSIVMGYPVITSSPIYSHKGTFEIITGNNEELMEKMDIIKHIEKDYPPTFIWTTKDDEAVPSMNSVLMDESLTKSNVKHQFVLFESGWHGASLANRSCYQKENITAKMKDIRDWASLAADFIFDLLD